MFSWLSFLYINLYDFILFSTMNSLLVLMFMAHTFRLKFIYFLLFIFIMTIWGFLNSYDGLMLMFISTEIVIVLFFFFFILIKKKKTTQVMTTSTTKQYCKYLWIINFIFYFIQGIVVFDNYFSAFNYNFVYLFNLNTISDDLFVFFQFFFVDYLDITYNIIILLNLFCIYFIIFYYALKYFLSASKKKNPKTVNFIRKQNALKQSVWKSQIRIFKK